ERSAGCSEVQTRRTEGTRAHGLVAGAHGRRLRGGERGEEGRAENRPQGERHQGATPRKGRAAYRGPRSAPRTSVRLSRRVCRLHLEARALADPTDDRPGSHGEAPALGPLLA